MKEQFADQWVETVVADRDDWLRSNAQEIGGAMDIAAYMNQLNAFEGSGHPTPPNGSYYEEFCRVVDQKIANGDPEFPATYANAAFFASYALRESTTSFAIIPPIMNGVPELTSTTVALNHKLNPYQRNNITLMMTVTPMIPCSVQIPFLPIQKVAFPLGVQALFYYEDGAFSGKSSVIGTTLPLPVTLRARRDADPNFLYCDIYVNETPILKEDRSAHFQVPKEAKVELLRESLRHPIDLFLRRIIPSPSPHFT